MVEVDGGQMGGSLVADFQVAFDLSDQDVYVVLTD